MLGLKVGSMYEANLCIKPSLKILAIYRQKKGQKMPENVSADPAEQ
jgi:hypothetical protein